MGFFFFFLGIWNWLILGKAASYNFWPLSIWSSHPRV